jgi:hypothetical protein
MTDARAIRATFSDYKTVKTRRTLQLVMEVPIEQQADVFEKLGYPMPDAERWVAIALLDPDAVSGSRPPPRAAFAPPAEAQEGGAKNLAKSWVAKEAYRDKTPGEKAVVIASMLIKDPEFQQWVGAMKHGHDTNDPRTSGLVQRHADAMLKVWCFGSASHSKSEFTDNETARIKLDEMRLEFEMAMGRRAEVR